jgi:beta-lactamase regulating signal transducer with metallopeptidase domain
MNSFTLFTEELARALAMTMVHSLWQGAIIVMVITLILQGRLGEQARNQYLVHFAGLGFLFLAAILTFCYQYSLPFSTSELTFSALPLTSDLASSATDVSARYDFDWQYLLSLIWFTGAMLFVIRLLVSSLHLLHIRHTSQTAAADWQQCVERLKMRLKIGHKVKLLISDLSPVPFIYGVLKPVIIVPSMYFNQLTDREIESIILHELAHIRRHDFAINLISVIIESLLFFNPATWWLTKGMKTQREFCCDDTVQQQIGNRNIYLRALYKAALISVDQQPNYSVALFHQNSELIMRVKRMLNTPGHRSVHFPFVTAGIGMVLLGLLFTVNMAIGQNNERKHIDKQDLEKIEVKEAIAVQPAVAPVVMVNVQEPKPVVVTVAPVVTSVTRPAMVKEIAISPASAVHVSPVIKPEIDIIPDTLPTSPKMEELQRKLEQKAEEMEELAELLEESIEENVENEMEKMEALMEQLEEMQEEKLEKLEGFENSEALERLENLAEELEEVMEEREEAIETSFPEELVESIAEEMERKAEAYDSDKPLTNEQRQKLDAEMKALGEKMKEAMKDYEINMREMEHNPEIDRIQKEMKAAAGELEPMHKLHEDIWTVEAKKLQEEIKLIQENMHIKMQGVQKDLQEKMERKAAEMAELSRQMEEEAKRIKGKGNQ